ncbi:hypothetical protein L2E82_48649 [Cichorium intybus]|uniref:Uncharacterized protein n=1 Tax=Cichorium intybus TaxID=13427 RepID=A0ACB8YZM5_CICIN|nr:hypothetical protein L2E82_48649 [Cichorium intybus]
MINSHVGVKENTRWSSDQESCEGENQLLLSVHDSREGENPETNKSACDSNSANTLLSSEKVTREGEKTGGIVKDSAPETNELTCDSNSADCDLKHEHGNDTSHVNKA